MIEEGLSEAVHTACRSPLFLQLGTASFAARAGTGPEVVSSHARMLFLFSPLGVHTSDPRIGFRIFVRTLHASRSGAIVATYGFPVEDQK
jgi:hypothetical protein